MKPTKKSSSPSKKYPPGSFIGKIRKRKIIETLSAFIGGGFLLYEIVHWILVDHYHLPEELKDITIVTILCVLFCTLTWQWFGGTRKRKKIKIEFVLIPIFLLTAIFLDIRFVLHMGRHKEEISHQIKWKNSIAVLPFVNISPEEGQDYFCDGITDELINRLSKIKELKVPARTSAFAFKGKEIDIREVGERLNVDKVLEGSVRKAGNRIRITTQLINIADGYRIWSEQYEREMEDIFKLQDEISLMIASKLKLQLLDEEKMGLTKRRTDNVEAYNLYNKGRYFLNKRTEDDLKNAIEYFEQAIESDGDYALAYTGLADTYITQGDWNFVIGKEAYSRARAAATKAIELDDLLPEAHNSLAVVKWALELDWMGAEKEFKRAIELNPNYVSAYQEYAEYLSLLGRFDDALREINKAMELDQLSPLINGTKALVLFLAREYDKSIEQCRKTLEIDTEFPPAFVYLGYCYIQKKMYKEALAMFQKAELLPQIALTLARMGKIEEARELIDVTFEQKFPTLTGIFHFIIGEKDKGFEWLEIAYENRGRAIMGIKVHPSFDDIRSDPRFSALIKKMNLE